MRQPYRPVLFGRGCSKVELVYFSRPRVHSACRSQSGGNGAFGVFFGAFVGEKGLLGV